MIETLPACFDMEEMLYELKDYACGMNAGRWDYIFSLIKVLKSRSDCVLPDRKQVGLFNFFFLIYFTFYQLITSLQDINESHN